MNLPRINCLLDIIENYRMINVKRDRLQYIYDQSMADALRQAIPDPKDLLNKLDIGSLKPGELNVASVLNLFNMSVAVTAINMAVDSYLSYQAETAEIAQEFLRNGWELDDEEAENLHESRKNTFMFMIEIVREDNLPGEFALSESAVEKFVSWKSKTNNYQKIQFFESELDTYQAYSNYWFALADCYYENEDYEKVLEAMDKYEELQADIFRKDYYYAQVLPKAIVAASEVYDGEAYISHAEKYLELLLANTESNEWSLRYFAAEIYLSLYAMTGDESYIQKSYDITLNNVNHLVAEQQSKNAAFLADVKTVTVPETASKSEKKQITDYNKFLKEQRKVELPPVYEPLVLNCDFLFALAEELDISQTEKQRIEGILRGDGNTLFLSEALENNYTFYSDEMDFDAKFDKDTLVIPLVSVSENSIVKVTVTNGDEKTVYEDSAIKEIKRSASKIDAYTVTYTSEKAGEQVWSADATVEVDILMDETSEDASIGLKFIVSKYKDLWVIPDTIEFLQVS